MQPLQAIICFVKKNKRALQCDSVAIVMIRPDAARYSRTRAGDPARALCVVQQDRDSQFEPAQVSRGTTTLRRRTEGGVVSRLFLHAHSECRSQESAQKYSGSRS